MIVAYEESLASDGRIYNLRTVFFEQADTTSIEAMIVKSQLRWSGHVARMADTRLPKQIMYSELETGKRTQGGQRKRYKDTLHHSLKQCLYPNKHMGSPSPRQNLVEEYHPSRLQNV